MEEVGTEEAVAEGTAGEGEGTAEVEREVEEAERERKKVEEEGWCIRTRTKCDRLPLTQLAQTRSAQLLTQRQAQQQLCRPRLEEVQESRSACHPVQRSEVRGQLAPQCR